MKLDNPFYRLPLRFDADALAAEVRALPSEAWVPHPQGFTGNDYVPLVTPSGMITNGFAGPMAPTPFLELCPYLREIMTTLDCVWGRARLMGLVPGATVPPHVDTNYYWRTHIRVHVPIVTNPDVRFTCGDETVHMAAGECWVFDTFRRHTVVNGGNEKRIHLVADTIGGERLWDLVHAAKQPGMGEREPQLVKLGAPAGSLRLEQVNFPEIMTPWEIRCLLAELVGKAPPSPALDVVRLRLERFTDSWAAAWAEHGGDCAQADHYRGLADSAVRDLNALGAGQIVFDNGVPLMAVLMKAVFDNVLENEGVKAMKANAAAVAAKQHAA